MCYHDFRIDHECIVCIKCGHVNQDEILHEPFSAEKKSYMKEEVYNGKDCSSYQTKENLRDFLERLKVSSSLTENVYSHYTMFQQKYEKYSKMDLLCYSLYLTLRNQGYQKTLQEISIVCGRPLKKLRKIENSVNETVPTLNPNYHLDLYCSLFNIGYKNQLKIEREIEEDMKNVALNSCNPETMCLGNIFHHLRSQENYSVKDFALKSGIKPGTLYRYQRNKYGSRRNFKTE